jgi:hypothetical protein
MKAIFNKLIFICFLFISGCATSQLELTLDIYSEDPHKIDITVDTLVGLNNKIQETIDASVALAKEKNANMEILTKTYIDTNYFLGLYYNKIDPTVDPAGAAKIKKDFASVVAQKEQYIKLINKLLADVKSTGEKAKQSTSGMLLSDDTGRRSHTARFALTRDLNLFQSSAAALIEPTNLKIETLLGPQFSKMLFKFSEINFSTLVGLSDQVTKRMSENFNAIIDRLKALQENNLISVSDSQSNLTEKLEALKITENNSISQAVEMPPLVARIQSASTNVENSQGIASAAMFLTHLTSQIDRIQDAADPAWREVTSKVNEDKWKTEFSETYFRGDGSSSVVIVRDTPISYRIQRGKNNPAALVKAQLGISRAIGNAALTIAGATTGINLTQMVNPSDGTDPKINEDGSSEALDNAVLKTTLQKTKTFRDAERKKLLNDLIALNEKSKEMTASYENEIDATKRTKILIEKTQLIEKVKGHLAATGALLASTSQPEND